MKSAGIHLRKYKKSFLFTKYKKSFLSREYKNFFNIRASIKLLFVAYQTKSVKHDETYLLTNPNHEDSIANANCRVDIATHAIYNMYSAYQNKTSWLASSYEAG